MITEWQVKLLYVAAGAAAGALIMQRNMPVEEQYIAVATEVVTVVKTETKEKETVKWRIRTTTKPDGTKIVTDSGSIQKTKTMETKTEAKEKTNTIATSTSIAPTSKYLFAASHTLPPWGSAPSWESVTLTLGAKLGNLPIYLTVSNPTLKLFPGIGIVYTF
jgi:hypothetical protein